MAQYSYRFNRNKNQAASPRASVLFPTALSQQVPLNYAFALSPACTAGMFLDYYKQAWEMARATQRRRLAALRRGLASHN